MSWVTPRAWVTGELVSAGLFNQAIRDNLLASRARLPAYGPAVGTAPGHWYRYQGSSFDVTTIAVDTLYLQPFFAPKSLTLAKLAINVETSGSFATIRIGLYTSDAHVRPDALVAEYDSFDASGTGFKYVTVGEALAAGTWWLGYAADNDDVDLYSSSSTTARMGIFGTSVVTLQGVNRYVSSADPYGGLPATVKETLTPLGGDPPQFLLKVA